jgi:hypothetical protein
VLVATLVAAWYPVAFIVLVVLSGRGDGPTPPWEWVVSLVYAFAHFVGPPIIVLLGLLGTRRRYSTASRIWAVVPLLIGAFLFRGMIPPWYI